MEILNVINNVPVELWDLLAEILFSAVIVSPIALGLKKWWKINSEKLMLFMVIFGSLASAALLFVTTAVPSPQVWVIGLQGWLAFATTQPVYFLFVKPTFRRIGNWFSGQVAKAAALNEVKTAAVPDDGLANVNITPVPVQPTDPSGIPENVDFTK